MDEYVLQNFTNKIKLLTDKDCSVGKALKRTYGTPRESNELGPAFSEVAKSDPGRIGDAATGVNEFLLIITLWGIPFI